MLNQIVLVGRLANIELKEETEEKAYKVANITLSVPRSFKNVDGEYETDFIPLNLIGSVAENTFEYCKKGDVIGVKGRIQKLEGEDLQLVAEKVTFLSSKKAD